VSEAEASHNIFLSYAHEDEEPARVLAEALRREGYSVWWDRIIVPGQNYQNEIQRAINKSVCVIVLWSRHSVDSDWVKEEASFARTQHKLIPVAIDDAQIPIPYGLIQTVSLSGWDGSEVDRRFRDLVDGVRERGGKTDGSANTIRPDLSRYSKPGGGARFVTWAWILLAAIVVGGITVALMYWRVAKKPLSTLFSEGRDPAPVQAGGYLKLNRQLQSSLVQPSPEVRKSEELMAIHQRRLQAWNQGFLPAALTAADELVERLPSDPEQHVARAVIELSRPDWPKCETDASAALEKEPKRADALYVRGVARLNMKRFQEALTDLNATIQIDPSLASAYFQRCLANGYLQRLDAGISDCTKFIRLAPDVPDGYFMRGSAYVNSGNPEAALKDMSKVIELQPGQYMAYAYRGDARLAMSDVSGALVDYNETIRLAPNYAGGYSGRARAKAARGETSAALEDANHAIELQPKMGFLYLLRSQIENALGDHSAAQEDYDKAQTLGNTPPSPVKPNSLEQHFDVVPPR
jgi:tetratricopeptide (TPR) repeat protein